MASGHGAGLAVARADVTCIGDCDLSHDVVVNELVVGVGIALGSRTIDDCLAADPNLDRDVAVNELIGAVSSLLNGCGGGSATATPTIDIGIPSPTGSQPPTATAEAFPPTYTATPGADGTATVGSNGATPTPTASPVNTAPGTSDEKLPRLVGAASASNTTIIVQFSKQMSDSVKDAAAYVITQEHVNPEAGHLVVTAANFLNGDPYTVKLTTLSQNEVTYRLRVVNVRDVLGNPLAQMQVVGGVIVDSSSSVFPGTPPSCGPHVCDNGSGGMGGMGLCATDADCPCPDGAPLACTSAGACADRCELRDSDADGVPDNVEQLGWVVTIRNTDGTTREREVTGEPSLADTDGDGLDDKTELQIGSDARRRDTDGDGLDDYEEYNVIYSDTNGQDTDGDGVDDKLEVEFFKTNALQDDSDGDGFDDGQELFAMNRDPRLADLPQPDISIGEVRLQIYEQFTYTDENGQTQTEDSSTQTSLTTSRQQSNGTTEDIGGGFAVMLGFAPTACGGCDEKAPVIPVGSFTGVFNRNVQTTDDSNTAAEEAFQTSLDKVLEFSSDSAVTRQVTGARVEVAVTFQNKSDIAFTLSNLEITALTSDPQDPTKLAPVATLLPDSQQQSGNAATVTVAPGQSRGPILFSNREVFPSLVEDLMKAPRGLVFKVANYDLTTGDGRNFAFGLQAVNERTTSITIDFGDGTVKQANAITAAVLERPRDEMRCARGGDHQDQACASDDDCGTSQPCAGGQIVGGLSTFGGTGKPAGIPIDFVLRDILQMRKTTPPVIFAGPDGTAQTTARGDDVQLANVGVSGLGAYSVVVSPGRNGVLETAPAGDDVASQGAAIVAGSDGVADTLADGDDLQVVPAGTRNLPSDAIVVAAVGNRPLSTTPSGDDAVTGPDGVRAGPDGIVQSVAEGDDVQLVPVGTAGVPDDTVAIAAGRNGVLDTHRQRDDVADVVTGYEVSHTCNYLTPSAIVAGPNGRADTTAAQGICTTAFPPHFVGEPGCHADADCGSDPNRPPGAYGVCTSDLQVAQPATSGLSPYSAVVLPKDAGGKPVLATYVRSVPPVSSDDAFVGPGIPCTADIDCLVLIPPIGSPPFPVPPGPIAGRCNGPETVVRVENRRSGQFRRYWALLTSDTMQLQTDFSQLRVRSGDAVKLGFIQDSDRDGLIAPEEFLRASSDFNRDTDNDGLDDFAEVRVGWMVGPIGQSLRRVFPDPVNSDSDGDGVTDRQEQDLRTSQCACDAVGSKTLLGSGNLLRGQDPGLVVEIGARPCSSDADCSDVSPGICRDTARCTTLDYFLGNPCALCDSDASLHRSDPRLRDTDGDGVADADEVFGYRTGAGIYSPPVSGRSQLGIIVAGADGKADSVACADNYCQEDVDESTAMPLPLCALGAPRSVGCRVPCQTDGDCLSHACIHPTTCEDVQVVPPGSGGWPPNTVVVAPGMWRVEDAEHIPFLVSENDVKAGAALMPGFCLGEVGGVQLPCFPSATRSGDEDCNLGPGLDLRPCVELTEARGALEAIGGDVVALSNAVGDDVQVAPFKGPAAELKGPRTAPLQVRCTEGSEFDALGVFGWPQRYLMCPIVRPGPNGRVDSIADLAPGQPLGSARNNVLVPGGSGQKIEVTDPLNFDTDGDEVADGNERLLGSSPNDPTDTGIPADTDRDGLTDILERGGWMVSVVGAAMPRMVASSLYVQDTDGDGLPDYAEYHMPCREDVTKECRTDPTNGDTDGDGLLDVDELNADQIAVLQRFDGFFPGYHFNGGTSKKYGTDALNADTDGDTLGDHAELLAPFYLSIAGESVVRTIFTDPTQRDSDHDGVDDNVEKHTSHTDPTDPDTDGDQRLDGAERTSGTDPLVPDILVTVRFNAVKFKGFQNPFGNFKWTFHVQQPADAYPGPSVDVAPDNQVCPVGQYIPSSCGSGACQFGNLTNVLINDSVSFPLRAGQGFVASGNVRAYAGCNGNSQTLDCDMQFLESYTYESVSRTGFTVKTEALSGDNGCAADVLFQITVN